MDDHLSSFQEKPRDRQCMPMILAMSVVDDTSNPSGQSVSISEHAPISPGYAGSPEPMTEEELENIKKWSQSAWVYDAIVKCGAEQEME